MRELHLDDKYVLESGRVFLTGIQALTLLPMLQRRRDQAAGLNTAGYVSGYRGSPLGGLDHSLWRAKPHLERHHVVFHPGLNEDLAATAIWGTQQLGLFPGARYDGIFSLWYGKGPGVDRCGDVFKHANSAGTARHGGVIAVAGDDHAARSSTVAHQSEHAFKAAMMPALVPSGVQEYIDFGLHGWALSRYSGCWVGFKAVADTVESAAVVDIGLDRVTIVLPEDFELPGDSLNIRWPDHRLTQEQRLLNYKLYAALAYCRANRLNRIVIDSPNPRLGIVACGKSYLDVRQAFDDLGLDDDLAAEIGIRLYKVGMSWPLESEGVRHFAEGLEEILVVEEKRQLIEYQLKEELYNWREDVRPRVIGKFDEKGEWALPHGHWLLPATTELTPAMIARVIADRIDRVFTSPRIRERLAVIEARERAAAAPVIPIEPRQPWFCPGCPHNTSTVVPAGSRALAGIGCHYMVTWMDRDSATFSHMGGEGVAWLGQAPFTEQKHVFVNLGDGTYFHSGILAIRAAVAAGVNVTYKLLYNDAVAMTGGQPVDGNLTVPRLIDQLRAEGVGRIAVVTDGSERSWSPDDLAEGVTLHHRDGLDVLQRQLREVAGVSALIFDQTCAAEKRRRRKRGKLADPPRRLVINEHVCEGCGDCSVQSNCLAVVPIATPFGQKRAIDQSACNKDYSCLKGFCPSFVTITNARLRSASADDTTLPDEPPTPRLPDTHRPYGILITGVGGTGVITLGALIGTAACIDGKAATVLDMTGLAQKGGAVFSHVRLCDNPDELHAVRIATGEADAVIGGDAIVTVAADSLARMCQGRTRVAVSWTETPTAEFIRNRSWHFPGERIRSALTDAVGADALAGLDAGRLAERLLGSTVGANTLLLGFAWQLGLVPVSAAAIAQAIALNGTAVDMNQRAFHWGRQLAHDPSLAARLLPATPDEPDADTLIARHAAFLKQYQDAAYAARYRSLIDRVRAAEAPLGSTRLTTAVAQSFGKLMAIKDEYEVARLFVESDFLGRLRTTFEPGYSLRFHLSPPWIAGTDPATGRPRKRTFGPWLLPVFRLLARWRHWRHTPLDLFALSPGRRAERALVCQYENDIARLLSVLTPERLDLAVELASLPEQISGFGPVREQSMARAAERRAALLAQL